MPGEPYRFGKLARKREDGSSYWHWCIKWSDDAGPHRVSLGTNDRAAAETIARDFWAKRTLGHADTIGQIVRAYLDTLGGKKDEKRKREAWKAAEPYWGKLRLAHVDKDTAGGYIDWRKRATNTIRNELATIRSAVHWAAEEKLIARADVPPIKLPAMPESEVEHLTKAQFRRFLAGCHAPHVQLFVQLALTTAARSKHLLALPWMRVDLEKRILNLKPPKQGRVADAETTDKEAPNKGRSIVPINERLHALLLEAKEAALTPFVIEHNGLRIASIRKGMEAASARSGVHCTPHMLRHSAAVWMAEERVPMAEIAAYLGHKDSRITESVYARFHPDYLQRAAKALDW